MFEHALETRDLAHRFEVDSAGTGGWHVGDQPDPRSMQTAMNHDIDISGQRCRKIRPSDFSEYDFIFGMDDRNLADLEAMSPTDVSAHVAMFLEYAGKGKTEIPDPYYGGDDGFEKVYQTLIYGSNLMIDKILEDYAVKS